MKNILYITIPFLLISCASNGSRSKQVYTHNEYVKMTYCVGMTDTAGYVAAKKLKGTSKKELLNYYRSRNNAKMNIATVKKVYSTKFTNTWDYSVSFFKECSLNLAGVPSSRINFASYCLQNTLIANVAHAFKKKGEPKKLAYKVFAKFKSKTPNKIVDKVYSSSMSRSEAKLDAWNSCMVKVSDG